MYEKEIPNHLVKAILVTLFCCMPFGVIAIVFAAQVNTQINMGNYGEAQNLSRQADNWGTAALICGIIPWLLWMFFIAMSIFAGIAGA